jgi:rhodanese-related sulfurtransferase
MTEKVEILDVRDMEDFKNSHIPGAKSIPLTDLEKRYSELNQDSPLLIVCNRGGQKSQKALEFLKDKGFKDAKILEGGILAWEEEQKK